MMSMAERMPSQLVESPEAELVREIESLIRKLATGKATQNELQLLQELQKRRVEMMRPKRRIPA
jgi:hypothetical protein